jgi:hypothetical protein
MIFRAFPAHANQEADSSSKVLVISERLRTDSRLSSKVHDTRMKPQSSVAQCGI